MTGTGLVGGGRGKVTSKGGCGAIVGRVCGEGARRGADFISLRASGSSTVWGKWRGAPYEQHHLSETGSGAQSAGTWGPFALARSAIKSCSKGSRASLRVTPGVRACCRSPCHTYATNATAVHLPSAADLPLVHHSPHRAATHRTLPHLNIQGEVQLGRAENTLTGTLPNPRPANTAGPRGCGVLWVHRPYGAANSPL